MIQGSHDALGVDAILTVPGTVAPEAAPPNRSRTQIIKDSGHYLAATLLAQGVGLFRSLMIPVLFSPAQLGIWNLMNVLVSYGEKMQLGLLDGMNKAIPLMRGESRDERTQVMKDSVFWMTLMLAAVGGVLAWLSSAFAPLAYAPALKIVAVIVFLQLPFSYLFSLLRVDNRYALISRGVAGLSIVSTALIPLLAFRSDDPLTGGLLGLAAAYAVIVLVWFVFGRYRFAWQLNGAALREALRLGVPIKMLGVVDAIFLSVDRWVIAAFLNEAILGHYALALMVSGLLSLIPGSVASVVYTRMLERYAVDQDPRAAGTLFLAPFRALAALMLLLSACAIVAVPVIIVVLLPRYGAAIPLVRTLVGGAFFLSIGLLSATYLTATNRQALMLKIQLGATAFSLIGTLLAVRLGFGVQGVAIVTCVAYAAVGLGYTIPSFWLVCRDRASVVRLLGFLLLPFLVMIVAVAAAHALLPPGGSAAREIGSGAARLAMVLSAVGVALWRVNRDGELLTIARTELNNSAWGRRRSARRRSLSGEA